jgi:hypothetical protein
VVLPRKIPAETAALVGDRCHQPAETHNEEESRTEPGCDDRPAPRRLLGPQGTLACQGVAAAYLIGVQMGLRLR